MKKLRRILAKNAGRGSSGRINVRHQGGRMKRFLRDIDFRRDKLGVEGVVESIEYDPNRGADVALICYSDGERRYVLSPEGLKLGQTILSSPKAPPEVGNALPLSNIPAGTQIHNIEITPGKGGQMVRGAGASAIIQGTEGGWVLVRLPSGEVRKFKPECYATVGQVGNIQARMRNFRKAGTKRRLGIRPSVRGTAQHPGAHPHGGGEGRSGVGLKHPKTPYGKKAVGKTRKKKKYSDKLIVKPRKKGKHS